MIVEGDIIIGRYTNGECYLVTVKRFIPDRKAIIVEYCNPQKSSGLFFLNEVLELTDELVTKIPEELKLIAQSFLAKKRLEHRV
jgi:hypothetical protein